ncbi:hypothetical protein Ancab_038662, partial [Ancistrocladus abbreviatus]
NMGEIFVSRDVVFHEETFPFKKDRANSHNNVLISLEVHYLLLMHGTMILASSMKEEARALHLLMRRRYTVRHKDKKKEMMWG